jgi:F-type H+-transporting ATPase subunit b
VTRLAGPLASWVLALGCLAAPAAMVAQAQENPKDARVQADREASEKKQEEENARLTPWKWANFALLAGAIVYVAAKNGPAFFAARSRQIRKDMIEAGDARKEAEQRAADVERKLANLAADIAQLREQFARQRQAETEQLKRHREEERAKIQAHAQREIESAGKTARLELKQYAASVAIELAERKIRERMTPATQDQLVSAFVHDLDSPSAAGAH